jgi:hypothetical protein
VDVILHEAPLLTSGKVWRQAQSAVTGGFGNSDSEKPAASRRSGERL